MGHASIIRKPRAALSGSFPGSRHAPIRFSQSVRTMNAKEYDRAYFDRWYRDPTHRVRATGETARKVNMVVALAEYYLGRRFGRSRNLRMARLADLAELRFERRFDLIICSDVAHYLRAPELRRGLSGFPELLEGLAFIELFTSRDAVAGDIAGFIARTPAWYRREFAAAGLMACGSHCYLAPHLMRSVCELERADS